MRFFALQTQNWMLDFKPPCLITTSIMTYNDLDLRMCVSHWWCRSWPTRRLRCCTNRMEELTGVFEGKQNLSRKRYWIKNQKCSYLHQWNRGRLCLYETFKWKHDWLLTHRWEEPGLDLGNTNLRDNWPSVLFYTWAMEVVYLHWIWSFLHWICLLWVHFDNYCAISKIDDALEEHGEQLYKCPSSKHIFPFV